MLILLKKSIDLNKCYKDKALQAISLTGNYYYYYIYYADV